VRQRAYWIGGHDPAVIENFLEFRGCFGALVRGQVGLATHMDRIEGPEEPMDGATRLAQLVGSGDL